MRIKRILALKVAAQKVGNRTAQGDIDGLIDAYVDAERQKAALSAIDALSSTPDIDNRSYGIIVTKKRALEREVDAANHKLEKADDIERDVIAQAVDKAIREELTKAGADRHAKILSKYIQEEHVIGGFLDEASGELRIESAVSLPTIIEAVKGDPSFAPMFECDNSPQGDGNPWRPGRDFNLSEQGRIYKEDPQRAKEMMTEAQGTKAAGGGLNMTELGLLFKADPAKARRMAEKYGIKLQESGS